MTNTKALAIIIKAFGTIPWNNFKPSVSVASLVDTAMHSPLTAYINVTEAMQPVFARGSGYGLEEAFDTIKSDMLTNTPLTADQKKEILDTVFITPTDKKAKKNK